jgi:tripartite-type tricarboxylate transporter receptor subunit TctC
LKFLRRHLLSLAVLAVVLPAALSNARAQSYPVKPVRLVVGFPPGGPNDILGRMISRELSERLGQPFIVENQPGASGNIATVQVARAPADGYTLLLVGPANAINPSLYPNPNFDFMSSIALVAGITREALVMLVHPSVPAGTLTEFIAYAKARPGKIRMASTGRGSSPHLSGQLFMAMTGIDMTAIHYSGGGPALKEMINGQAQVMFEPMSAAIEPVRSGKLRPLAVTTAERSEALPDVPTMAESLTGYVASAVTGVGAPKNTPAQIVDALNRTINAALADPEVKSRLAELGGAALSGSPAAFESIMASEIENWAKVVKVSGARAD